MRRLSLGATAVALGLLGYSTLASAGPADLAPHRAIYTMGLATTQPGSGVAGASGTMTYQFADTCDGWTTENRIAITYAYAEGGQVESTTDFLTWESKDGLKYRFRMRNTRDGEVTEDIEGTAELKAKNQGGVVRFTRPEQKTMKLPKGTLFPTEHTQKLIDAARSGGKTVWKVVFDGSGIEGPFEVNALIGRPAAEPQPAGGPSATLTDGPAWPVSLAFYPVASSDPIPDFEMGMHYHANGVATDIMQNFKNFSLKGKLDAIEPLPKRGC